MRARRRLPALAALALPAAIAAAVATTWSAGASANPLDTFGFGSRGAAMGDAAAADVRDFSANYYNPAGLVLAHGLELSIGYFRADSTLKINGLNSGVNPVKGLVAGVVAPGVIFKIPFAFGLGIHLPDDELSLVRAQAQDQPRWELYDNRNSRIFLATNVAISPWPWLQIGGGLSFMSATSGTLDISGDANIFAPEESQLRHEITANLAAIRYPQAGVRIALGKRGALALVYRGQFKLSLDLKADLHGDLSGLTTALYQLDTQSVDAFLPQQVVAGGSWLFTDDLRVNFDATWVNWSAYLPPVATINVNLDIPPPAGGWPSTIMPPTTPAPTVTIPINMHDTVVPHLGVEYRVLARPTVEAFVRAGYEYAKSPIPAQTGLTNYIDRDRHTVTFGIGGRLMKPIAELPGDVRLDAHLQYSVLPEGVTKKADPSDLVGDYTAGGTILAAGATLTVGF